MRKQILALAASLPLVLSFAAPGANAQQDDETYGYHSDRGYHGGGYGPRGHHQRGERGGDYGPGWRGRQGGGYGPGWRSEYRTRQDDDDGPGRSGQRGMRGQFGMMGMMPPGMMMRMMLTLMDTDNDGAISLSEFQAAHERMFKAIDANKDGRVTIEEMQAWMQGRPTSAAESKPAQ
jgi:EF hand domain-containing protein